MAAWISASRGEVLPSSDMASIPGEATAPGSQKATRSEWVPPMRGEKWGLGGKSTGWLAAFQVASKVTRYRARGSEGRATGVAVAAGVGTAEGPVPLESPPQARRPVRAPAAIIALHCTLIVSSSVAPGCRGGQSTFFL
jgi:septum formation inhibitor MinC